MKIDESISFNFFPLFKHPVTYLLTKVFAVEPGTQRLNGNRLDSVTCCVETVSLFKNKLSIFKNCGEIYRA